MAFRRGGSLLPLSSVFASFIGAALVAGVFSYNNYRFSRYKFVDFSVLTFYEKSEVFVPEDDKFLLVVFSSNQSDWREILKISNKNLKIVAVDLLQKRAPSEGNITFIASDINTVLKLINTLSISSLPASVELKLQKGRIYKQDSKINKI